MTGHTPPKYVSGSENDCSFRFEHYGYELKNLMQQFSKSDALPSLMCMLLFHPFHSEDLWKFISEQFAMTLLMENA